ncbi:arsenate reductase family protein [Mesorhizobium mediterraneum]|uniref:arsenate reductase family protein n=1 Tax=Mesorhizobium mediterraneum TaxID=43617 RepID=UPI003D7ECE23
MTITIYHNPDCGTSRNTLAIIRQSGEEPDVIEYLKNPPSRERLVELIKAMGMTPRELLREKGTPYAELNLGDPKWTDGEIVDFMLAHPILMAAREGYAVRRTQSRGPQMDRRRDRRFHAGASDPDQPADCRHTARHHACTAVRSGSRHPAQS